MFVVKDKNNELVTFTTDEEKAIRFARKFFGKYEKIR